MSNIALIGAGALGKRHLQSLYDLHEKYDLYVVEVNKSAISALQEEMPDVRYVESISSLPKDIAAAVIATSSNVRRTVFDELINSCNVDNIIFEKVLFQREEDFYAVKDQLEQKGIHAWVNCARREWQAYKDFREKIKDCKVIECNIVGGAWGMGCNAIHMLDIIEYLAGCKVDELDISKLEPGIEESKRRGFYEFYGTITGSAGKCKRFCITSIKESALPLQIEFVTENGRYIIQEWAGRMLAFEEESGWTMNECEFRPTFQSQMTARVVKDILDEGKASLTDYEDSMDLHLKYIIPLISYFNDNGIKGDICPIT